jgi:hypothetical protein
LQVTLPLFCPCERRSNFIILLIGTSTRKRASATTSSATKRRRVDAKGGVGRGDHSDVDELSYSESESARVAGKSREGKKGEKQRPSSAPESEDWRLPKLPMPTGSVGGNGGYKARHSVIPHHDMGESDDGDEAGELNRTVDSIRRAQSGIGTEFLPSQLMAMDDKLDEVLRGIGKWVGSVADKLSQEDVREWLKVKSESQSNFRNWADNLGKS